MEDRDKKKANQPAMRPPDQEGQARLPEQIWVCLTDYQQQAVFQSLVWLCQEVLQEHHQTPKEVPHEFA
jgi:hypothetical protein